MVGKRSITIPTKTLEQVYQVYLRQKYKDGGLRGLSETLGISFQTLRRRFIETYGEDYRQQKTLRSIVTNEYLKDPNLKERHRTEIENWLKDNHDLAADLFLIR